MDTAATQTNNQNVVIEDLTQEELDAMEELDQRLDVAIEVSRLQDLAKQIEVEGTPEMKIKLKPFKEHYDGEVMTLISKRTKQNFDNDVWQEVSKAGDEAKAKYRQNPEGYLNEQQRAEYWEKAYDKTIEEARKLAQNLEQVLQSKPASADAGTAPKRRLFNR